MIWSIIVACDKNDGIGYEGNMPWRCLADLKYFQSMTTHVTNKNMRNAVVMGRLTWESLPRKPLLGRLNVVLSRSYTGGEEKSDENVVYCSDLRNVPSLLTNIETVWCIGGTNVYTQCLKLFNIRHIYKTIIDREYKCDRFFPSKIDGFSLRSSQSILTKVDDDENTKITYEIHNFSGNHAEYQYLDHISRILNKGITRKDRTGVGTYSMFGLHMRFDLREHFPLLTTKRVFFRGVVEELLWFLRGDTSVRRLQDKKVRIWDGNAGDSEDLGPIYGFQWRHFGAKYEGCDADYSGKGIDQVARVIHLIKTNPTSRRMIISAWNPVDLDQMALPPCHVLYQFYVENGHLSCSMYQRSGDMGLGVPFNIASASLLTHIVANITDLKPGELIHTIGDAHVYTNHVEPLRVQCSRVPRSFPRVQIKKKLTLETLSSLQYKDILCEGYMPHPKLPMKMAV